jgi:hypothetical protein
MDEGIISIMPVALNVAPAKADRVVATVNSVVRAKRIMDIWFFSLLDFGIFPFKPIAVDWSGR